MAVGMRVLVQLIQHRHTIGAFVPQEFHHRVDVVLCAVTIEIPTGLHCKVTERTTLETGLAPIDALARTRPRVARKTGQAFLQHRAVEGRVMGNEQIGFINDPRYEIVIDHSSGQVGVGNAGQPDDVFGQREAGILAPGPALADLHDDTIVIITEPAHRQLDHRVLLRVETGRLHVEHQGRGGVTIDIADTSDASAQLDLLEDARVISEGAQGQYLCSHVIFLLVVLIGKREKRGGCPN